MSERIPEQSEAILQARAKAQQLAAYFEEVFGQPKKRTPGQQFVLEHLETCAGDDANSYRFNEGKDGVAIIGAGIHRDGARSLLRVIDRQLSIASKSKIQRSEKAKPKTVR